MASISGESLEAAGETETNPLGVYEGERNLIGERHGNGKTLLANGDMYVGSYCKGLRHGKGIYVFKNGARYDGEWRRGFKYGQGIFWYPDGTRYEDAFHVLNLREGEWKRDTKYGFGAYHYANKDIYEGGWKKNFRHGLGTYLYAATGSKFMGTWIRDRMEGPGQLVHQRYRFHGSWQRNLPYGRGCFNFENSCMQHGHYIHVKDSKNYEGDTNGEDAAKSSQNMSLDEVSVGDGNKGDAIQSSLTEKPVPLKQGVFPIWRARYVTPYDPDLLPSEPVPIKEEVSEESLPDTCEGTEQDDRIEEYLPYPEAEYRGEYDEDYYGDARIPVTPDFGE